MSDILLAKPNLPSDWIDVSVGEPHIVREHLLNVFELNREVPNIPHMYEYPSPQGYKPLVQLLEEKYRAPVIVTNGAKQAIGACFYALKQLRKEQVGMKLPYWALIPPLAEMHGLKCSFTEPDLKFTLPNAQPDCKELRLPEYHDSYLLLAPNNPCGSCASAEDLVKTAKAYKEKNIPFIHDAAYYTHIYLPESHALPVVGDAQIFSVSKMLGLSGLRLGWVVCPNKEFYKLILQYMEDMTVGASIVSQTLLHQLMNRMHGYPTLVEKFQGLSALSLAESKKIIQKVDPEILEVSPEVEKIPGMFGWFKVGPKANFEKAKINFIDGALFGVPGMVRINLAFDKNQMQEIVDRLNSAKEP